jgi:hypothetical protein
MQQGLRKVIVSRNGRTQSPLKRHTRESGYPASVYKHEILSGMDSRFHGNDLLAGQQWLSSPCSQSFYAPICSTSINKGALKLKIKFGRNSFGSVDWFKLLLFSALLILIGIQVSGGRTKRLKVIAGPPVPEPLIT